MDKDNKNLHNENSIEDSLKSAFGYADEQFLDEFYRAEQNPDSCEDKAKLGYKNLRFQLEKSGFFEREVDLPPKKKYVRLKSIGKVFLVAAVLLTLVMMSGIGVVGQKGFEYQPSMRSDEGKNIVWDNTTNLTELDNVERAYREIKEQLGIKVLKLNYIPNGMVYSDLKVIKGHATIKFDIDKKKLYLIQVKYSIENSDGFSSDRVKAEEYKIIHNYWLDKDIVIRKNELDDGNVEYEAELYEEKAYYYLSGVIDEESFIKIIEGLSF